MSSKTCRYIYLISHYLVPILQILNKKYASSYTNNLITTKCLNTAVMLTILLIGEHKIKDIQQCDVSNTIQRHKNFQDNNLTILEQLKKSILRKNRKNSVLYYIMLTDGKLRNTDIYNPNSEYFPGHVFIVEKNINGSYYIYQSFIQKYSLKDFLKENKCKSYNRKDVQDMCAFFSNFLDKTYVWNDVAVKQWCKLTTVDTSRFLKMSTDNIFLCYKKFTLKSVDKNLMSFVNTSLKEINRNDDRGNCDEYDSKNYLNNSLSSRPFSLKELEQQFKNLKKELIKYKDK